MRWSHVHLLVVVPASLFESKVIFVLGLQFVKNHSCKYLKEADLQIILSESLSPFQTFSYCYLLFIIFLHLLILYFNYL